MTDEHDSAPELDPAEDVRIRALLADLGSGSDDPPTMPPEVAARLDATLADLSAERGTRSSEPAHSTVRPLRRRWSGRLAAAAAAVIVVGVGGVAVSQLGGSGNDAASSSDAGGGSAGGQAEDSTAGGDTERAPTSDQPSAGLLPNDLPQVSADSFKADVTQLLRRDRVPSPAQGTSANERKSELDSGVEEGGCPGPDAGDGSDHSTVLYDGSPAALVVHPAEDGQRLVEAWTCSGDERLAGTRVAAPVKPGLGDASPTP